MQSLVKISRLNSSRLAPVLTIVLVLAACLSAYFISTSASGVVYVMGLAGLILGLAIIFYPLVGFYFCYILSFFIFDLIRFFNTDLPVVALLDVLVYLTFVGVLVNKLAKREPFWKNCRSPIVVMYLLILSYFIFEFFNPNGGNSELYFLSSRRYIALLLFLYCSIQLFTDYKRIRQFFIATLALSAITALYACYQQWFGLPKYEIDAMFRDPDLQNQILFYMALGSLRNFSFLSDCTAFGLLMSATTILALTFFLKLNVSQGKKALLLFFVILLALAMSFTGTRTATVMLLGEICLYMLLTFFEWKTLVFFMTFLFLCAVIMFAPRYGNKTLPRLRSTFDTEDASLNVRNVNRHNIQPYIYSHPIGGGIRTTGVVFEKYNQGHPLAGFPTDSGLLTLVLELGWVGLLIQCATYFVFLQQGIHSYFKSNNPTYKAILLGSTIALFGYVIAQYSQIAIGQIPSAFLFYALIAVVIRLPQIEHSTAKNLNNNI